MAARNSQPIKRLDGQDPLRNAIFSVKLAAFAASVWTRLDQSCELVDEIRPSANLILISFMDKFYEILVDSK